jgi:hypothetical protein
MSWIERLKAQKKAAKAEHERVRVEEQQRHLAPSVWRALGDALLHDVQEFNATHRRRRLMFWRTEERIEVVWDGSLALLVSLDFDPRRGAIRYVCPNPAPNTGHPCRGEYQVTLDDANQPYLFGETTRGAARVGRVEPRDVCEAILGPVLFPD